jgi:hypothetical protein
VTLTPTSDRRPRWWRYVHAKQLLCPCQHHIKNVQKINDSGFIQCLHWIAAEQRECGLWIFILPIRGGRAIVVEVSEDDTDAMGDLQTPGAMLDFLGIFEPSALALIGAPPPRASR